ncbi:FecR domain-containing protein [Leptolyngbya sp. FACHB-36]|uniref:FecR family protein n=1 Tax=Leptolyngbya sp. FACHB-36 TaxID=2692808 RepID=UPI00168114D0|nr:FecR domain-containing protein [Leptolyngbya sp. FACHB-36]MBD2021595.1 FecR domain-containing protein [Leptolyngbya sp. FACHB-36]
MLIALLLSMTHVGAQQTLRVRVNRAIAIQQVAGTVTCTLQRVTRSAQVGDRLQTVGDSIATGKNSTATLAVDTGIGFINVAENTQVRVRQLEYTPDNGRITRLQVTQGQVRLRVRRLTNPGSTLEIQTPAGISGVRGTEFGLGVQPNGKTGLAVLQGGVQNAAQGRAVAVNGGFQNFTIPGEPPSTPVPLREDTRLKHQFRQVIEGGVRKIQLVGQVDPVNLVLVEGNPQVTDRRGQFRTELRPVPSYLRLRVTVITPLGKQQVYDLALR